MKKSLKSLALVFTAALAFGMMGCQPNVTEHVHTYSDTWSKDTTHHWHAATCEHTDEVKDRAEHGFGAWSEGRKSCTTCGYEVVCQHTYGDWKVTKEATETEGGMKARFCSVCNIKGEERPTPNLTHVHSWSDKWSNNETNHWYACSGCLEEKDYAKHEFGAWSEGKKSCTTCGYEVVCQHTWSDWARTDDKHWKICTVCRIRTEEADHSLGGWVTSGEALHWKECSVCGDRCKFADHTFGEWVTTDESNHWKECSGCKKKIKEAVHSYKWVITDENHSKECNTCGKKTETKSHNYVQKGNGWQRCSDCDKENTTAVSLETLGTYTSLGGGKYTFGVYPQTIKADSVTVDKSVKNTEIAATSYYLGSDGAWYAECVENGYSTGSDYQYSDGSYVSKKNESSPKTLYFKVEPVEWVKLSTTGCLVASKILTSNVPYYEKDKHRNDKSPNNYQHSQIRAYLNGTSYNALYEAADNNWLNKGFLQTAFTSNQQTKIKTTTVDNSIASTGYDINDYTCEDTNDKIFLLSYKEAFTDNGLSNTSRIRKPTDYALANYCYIIDSTNRGNWWLRSPDLNNSNSVRDVDSDGSANIISNVAHYNTGIVPALSVSE